MVRLMLCLAIGLSLVPAVLMAQVPAATPMTPDQQESAIANARAVWTRMTHAHNVAEMGELLTNRSAGMSGIIDSVMVAMDILSVGMPSEDAASSRRQKVFNQELNALMLRYGLSSEKPSSKSLSAPMPPLLEKNGRQFLRDLNALDQKVTAADKNAGDSRFGFAVTRPFASFGVTVLSPSRVRLDTRDPRLGIVEARVEDGKWRIDLGDWKHFVQQMRSLAPPPKTQVPPVP